MLYLPAFVFIPSLFLVQFDLGFAACAVGISAFGVGLSLVLSYGARDPHAHRAPHGLKTSGYAHRPEDVDHAREHGEIDNSPPARKIDGNA